MNVFFFARHLYYLPQFLPVAAALGGRHDVSIGYSDWVTPEEETVLRAAIESGGWHPVAPSDVPAKARHADVLIIGAANDVQSLAGPSTLAVLLFHSIGLKKVYYTDSHPRIDLRFVESDYHRDRCLSVTPDVETLAVGFAKLDPLYAPSSQSGSSLPSKPGPRLLYAPTFYPGSLELLGHLIPSWPSHWQIVIKPHQFTHTNPFYRYQRVLLDDLARRCSNVTVLPLATFSILSAFQWADVLVSEASSTIIEFSALDRPIVICDQLHLRLHHRWRNRYIDRRMDAELLGKLDFAWHAPSAAEVAPQIEAALDNPGELAAQRQLARDLLLGPCDGQAAQRVVAAIEDRLA
ncbi:MAG: CDP-glycerol glycerophosphotransferase family protein [Candidatus Neomarinimicrobiota bacterium]